MKRLLLVLLLMAPAAYGQDLQADTATSIPIHLVAAADGTAIESATVTDITLHWSKNGVFSETEACAASATDHDCVESPGGNGVYFAEVSADKVSDGGLLCVAVEFATAIPYTKCFTVKEDASYAATVEGNNLDSAGVQAAAAAANAAINLDRLIPVSGTIGATGNTTTTLHLTGLPYGDGEIDGWLLQIYDDSATEYHQRFIQSWADTGDLATVATLPFTPEDSVDTYILLPAQSGPLVQAGSPITVALGPFRSSTDFVTAITTGTPVCTYSPNDPDNFGANPLDNSPSAVGSNGHSELTLSAAETTEAGSGGYINVHCTLTDASPVDEKVYVQ